MENPFLGQIKMKTLKETSSLLSLCGSKTGQFFLKYEDKSCEILDFSKIKNDEEYLKEFHELTRINNFLSYIADPWKASMKHQYYKGYISYN